MTRAVSAAGATETGWPGSEKRWGDRTDPESRGQTGSKREKKTEVDRDGEIG